MVDLSRKKFSQELTNTLNEEFGRYAEQFESERARAKSDGAAPKVQSHLLVDYDLPKPSCELGAALLEELQRPLISDVTLVVDGERFLCHKIVLTSRCGYFGAMMQNQWSEARADEITLNNIKPNAVAAVLCYLYGASSEFPKFCNLVDALQVSDMLGITGIASVAQFYIRFEICHNFHKPCQDCIVNMPEVINLATLFSLTDLYKMCMKWNSKHFAKMWPTKAFASLNPKHQAKCMKTIVDSMNVDNIIHLLMEADKLLSGMTRVQWTKPVVSVASDLMTSCCDFVASHFLDVTTNMTILVLFQGMGWKTDVIERILVQIGSELTVENVCDVHIATSRLVLLGVKERWNQEFLSLLEDLTVKVWNYLVSNYYAIVHTESWHHVSSADKMKLKSETLCQGDLTRKLSKRPVLSSSLPKNTEDDKKANPTRRKKKCGDFKRANAPTKTNIMPSKESNSSLAEPTGPPPDRQKIIATQEMRWAERFNDVIISPPPK